MNLNKNNLFARFYVWYFNRLPVDFCSYFWNTLFAVVTLPLSAPAAIPFFDAWKGNIAFRAFKGVGLYSLFVIISVVGGLALNSLFPQLGNWWPLVLGSVAFALIAGVGIGSVTGVIYTGTKVYEVLTESTTTYWIKDTIAAIRGKYCVKINWK